MALSSEEVNLLLRLTAILEKQHKVLNEVVDKSLTLEITLQNLAKRISVLELVG